MVRRFLLLSLAVFVVSGCGYTTKTLLPEHVKTIYIDNVLNKIDITKETEYRDTYHIYRPGLERKIRRGIKERFIFDGKLKVVNTKEKADSVLETSIVAFEKQPLQYLDDKTVDEYRLKMVVGMKFTDLAEGDVLVDIAELVGETTYTLNGPFAKTETAAQDDAVTDLSRRIIERVVDLW